MKTIVGTTHNEKYYRTLNSKRQLPFLILGLCCVDNIKNFTTTTSLIVQHVVAKYNNKVKI